MNLYDQAKKYIAGGVNSPVRAFKSVGGTPVFFKSGKGKFLNDSEGKQYTDFVLGWGPQILGHSHPAIVTAVRKRVQGAQCFGAPTVDETNLAKLLFSDFPSSYRSRLVNSGTEATMSALRLARAYSKRKIVVKFEGCYHGHSDGLLVKAGSGAITVAASHGVPSELIRLTQVLPYNDHLALEKLCKKMGKELACIIVEPIAGNMGVVMPTQEFVGKINRVSVKYDIPIILDEVITGFRFRFGPIGKKLGYRNNITTLGKIIGGGMPIGAYIADKNILKLIAPDGPVYQAGTLSGNPIAVSAGLAQLEYLKDHKEIYRKLNLLGEHLEEGLKRTLKDAIVNRYGSMFTIFFTNKQVTDLSSALECNTKRYAKFFHYMLKKGFYMPPSQFEAAFLCASHTHNDIDKFLQAIYESKI